MYHTMKMWGEGPRDKAPYIPDLGTSSFILPYS